MRKKKLSEEPFVHPTAHISDSVLGRYPEVAGRWRAWDSAR